MKEDIRHPLAAQTNLQKNFFFHNSHIICNNDDLTYSYNTVLDVNVCAGGPAPTTKSKFVHTPVTFVRIGQLTVWGLASHLGALVMSGCVVIYVLRVAGSVRYPLTFEWS